MTVTLVDEDITCPTPNPEPSQPPPPLGTDLMPEPSTEADPEPVAMNEPVVRTEPTILLESDPNLKSDQVCELAIASVPVSVLEEFEGMEWSPTHTPTAEGELHLASAYCYEELEEESPIPAG